MNMHDMLQFSNMKPIGVTVIRLKINNNDLDADGQDPINRLLISQSVCMYLTGLSGQKPRANF